MIVIFGWIGSVISLIYKMPQLYLLWQKKTHEGISLLSISVQAFSYVFYILHGFFIGDQPVLFMGVACLLQSLCLIAMYFKYKKTPESNHAQTQEHERPEPQ